MPISLCLIRILAEISACLAVGLGFNLSQQIGKSFGRILARASLDGSFFLNVLFFTKLLQQRDLLLHLCLKVFIVPDLLLYDLEGVGKAVSAIPT